MWGSHGKKFYIVLDGCVAVRIPNPDIENFSTKFAKYLEYCKVKEWEKEYARLEAKFLDRKAKL